MNLISIFPYYYLAHLKINFVTQPEKIFGNKDIVLIIAEFLNGEDLITFL
jgi:hypothetical protein